MATVPDAFADFGHEHGAFGASCVKNSDEVADLLVHCGLPPLGCSKFSLLRTAGGQVAEEAVVGCGMAQGWAAGGKRHRAARDDGGGGRSGHGGCGWLAWEGGTDAVLGGRGRGAALHLQHDLALIAHIGGSELGI